MDYYGAFRPAHVHASKFSPVDKSWIRLAHTSVIVGAWLLPPIGGVVGPLLVDRLAGERSRTVERESIEAVNFGITLSIGCLLARVLTMVQEWTLTPPASYTVAETLVLLIGLVYVRRARKAVAAYEPYRYPFTVRPVCMAKPRRSATDVAG